MIQLNIKDFLLWGQNPNKGETKVLDSKVVDLVFEKDDQEYDIKARIEVEYTRWFLPETYKHPKEDEYTIKFFDVDLIKGNNNDKELSEKELRRLREYIINNIEFV